MYIVSLCLCLLQAEARLAAKRAARAEAREIRMKELERQQKEVTHTHLCTVVIYLTKNLFVFHTNNTYCLSIVLPSLLRGVLLLLSTMLF
jgi:hypothetical protein